MLRVLIVLFFNLLLLTACGGGEDNASSESHTNETHLNPTINDIDTVQDPSKSTEIHPDIDNEVIIDTNEKLTKEKEPTSLADFKITAWDGNYKKSGELHDKNYPYLLKMDKSLTQLAVEESTNYMEGAYHKIFKASHQFSKLTNDNGIWAFIGSINGEAKLNQDSDSERTYQRYILGVKNIAIEQYKTFEQYTGDYFLSQASNEDIFHKQKNALHIDFNNKKTPCSLTLDTSVHFFSDNIEPLFCDSNIISLDEAKPLSHFKVQIGSQTKNSHKINKIYGELEGFIVYNENTSYILGIVIPNEKQDNKTHGIDYFILSPNNDTLIKTDNISEHDS